MSQEKIKIVRAAYDAVNRGDLDAAISNIAPEMEYVASGAVPGATGIYLAEGVKRSIVALWEEFDEARAEVTELLAADDRVVVSATARGRGKLSGAEAMARGSCGRFETESSFAVRASRVGQRPYEPPGWRPAPHRIHHQVADVAHQASNRVSGQEPASQLPFATTSET